MLACVLSPLGGSGKTTVALNTARAGVLAGKKVLAVELDFSPGSFRSLLQIERGKALAGAVNAENWQDFVAKTHYGFDVLPAGLPDRSEHVDLVPYRDFLKRALSVYDYVVVDTPPTVHYLVSETVSNFSALNLIVIPGIRGLEGVKRTAEWAEFLKLKGVLKTGTIVLNQFPRKLVWAVGEVLEYPIGASLPETKELRQTPVNDEIARQLAPLLGLEVVPERKGLFSFLMRKGGIAVAKQ
ncbi:ParA family protein [Carboxydothermus ferrireducens]|uniref:Cellulose biosynthesis protein BcsQ n=1 Tax=Carboxydothermus ferrireducens DSM 11255 TaxID=1119529 RepID=A0ABX2R898_9THEO|nr:AAA family ATPase [Carboxydothermus ferrireducens]NYE57144.1 cellulose biosynthesis protein BcsQ [Carboxydothermus ferrireducens DSM 11255]